MKNVKGTLPEFIAWLEQLPEGTDFYGKPRSSNCAVAKFYAARVQGAVRVGYRASHIIVEQTDQQITPITWEHEFVVKFDTLIEDPKTFASTHKYNTAADALQIAKELANASAS